MRIGIDASNLRAGGGVTHLVELLKAAEPQAYGFDRVIVWASQATLNLIESRPWLLKEHQSFLDRALPFRLLWQMFTLSRLAQETDCDVLFIPGGSYYGSFRPFVTICRNMLPFEWGEIKRYGISPTTARLLFLRKVHGATFRKADGLIFLSDYARSIVLKAIRTMHKKVALIPHGVDDRFRCPPRPQRALDAYSAHNPFILLYVSIVNLYKHQEHVAEAVGLLRAQGLPVAIDFVGPASSSALKRLNQAIRRYDPEGHFIRYVGPVPFAKLHKVYHQADAFVFASSCENMPNILLEAMASGLPIACSNRGPMPEVLGDGGVYFDPEKPREIAQAVQLLLANPALREEKAWLAYERARLFTWDRCARETFDFIARVAG